MAVAEAHPMSGDPAITNPVDRWLEAHGHAPHQVIPEIVAELAGSFLGRGQTRAVFELRSDPTLVLKIELRSDSFANVGEWRNWHLIKDTADGHWFAPCVHIAASGLVLIQQRTDELPDAMWPLQSIPRVIVDRRKRQQFGLLEDRPVCRDYEFLLPRNSEDKFRDAAWRYAQSGRAGRGSVS